MAKVPAKKAVAKKGKYFQIISSTTQCLGARPVGPWRHGLCLRLHTSDMGGWQPTLSVYEVEVR